MKTIVALSTPPMNGAIHIIRITGNDTYSIINKIINKKIVSKGYIIQKANIVDNKKIIDHVLLMTFVSPQSFTGEDLVEINCHGGYYLATKIIQLLIRYGAKLAKPGEFLQRAYLNSKISIHEAEAINNIINASSESAIDFANNGLSKSNLQFLNKIRDSLFLIIGNVEVNVDYPEYENNSSSNQKIINKLNKLIVAIEKIVRTSTKVLPLLEGINVAIVGRTNVGKSSLLNALVNESRAIVSNTPGTTRDVINVKINISGLTFNFHDTAGYRETSHHIEKMGVNKTLQAIEKANIVLWVIDGSKPICNDDLKIKKLIQHKKYLVIKNKSDLKIANKIKGITISAKNKEISKLIHQLPKYVQNVQWKKNFIPILQSTHSINVMEQILENLNDIKKSLAKYPVDLVLEKFHIALKLMDMIIGTGKEYNFLDELFRKFCIGK